MCQLCKMQVAEHTSESQKMNTKALSLGLHVPIFQAKGMEACLQWQRENDLTWKAKIAKVRISWIRYIKHTYESFTLKEEHEKNARIAITSVVL